MKSIVFICIILGVFFSCNSIHKENIKNTKVESSELREKDKKVFLNIEALQGVWAENEEENALFYIKDTLLFYTENQDNPIIIKLKEDDLLIMGDAPVHCKILKLTRDSLWYIDEFSATPTKLYKRQK
jgi:hypothetical protein